MQKDLQPQKQRSAAEPRADWQLVAFGTKWTLPASQQARERGTRVTSTRATTSECATTSDECAAQSFARALRAYHGTLSPRWGPTSDQCEIVRARAARLPWNARPPVGLSPTSSGSVPAPSSRPIQERAASCSSPPTHPPRCGAVARSEKINLAVGQKSTYVWLRSGEWWRFGCKRV